MDVSRGRGVTLIFLSCFGFLRTVASNPWLQRSRAIRYDNRDTSSYPGIGAKCIAQD
ncbi:hypothetical protein PF005_g30674 [Phytophthora fragariae]|uniref:Uncharacterized protein n=1 Tax=Phytophthora fragariae TaxID=53985 RepID=A0A6A3GX19_9STRA|nr:hypothetical protein PF003_g37757 [Phytophthora fragariae]KAE8918817.1 hypothetical protein PF009_g30871 [Phytophthora fragariae]KAE8961544.1 hypothetical protein PF011_g29713 [Phytophthora fragariae]KAE9060493.1 hypothetical protein PF010_g30195 [Phytophthora fragariae]KAE9061142.1 hypothetical protein PF007_g30359 [Phytophthora fragariae]